MDVFFDDPARTLATAFLAGPFELEGLIDRGAELIGHKPKWLTPLARRICTRFATRPRYGALLRIMECDRSLRKLLEKCDPLWIEARVFEPREIKPLAVAAEWRLPELRTAGELANWLGIDAGELAWLADLKHLGAKSSAARLHHYHYRILAKRAGQVRLIECPKPRLKDLQRQILFQILNRIPPHHAVHGFRTDHSIKTFAAPHAGREVVLRLDLQDFFPSINAARVRSIFSTLYYPGAVATLLAGLCTNVTPRDIWPPERVAALTVKRHPWPRIYEQPHLPQGAPTSPALANLCAYRLDCRLAALAQSAGATYTRYADDLAFSGDAEFARRVQRFPPHVAAIVMEEGLTVNHRKTRIMRRGVRQHLAGLVVNEHPNIRRADFDVLKATLTNCLRHGPASQNRESRENFRAHLLGQISFVEMVNPGRGLKLRKLFEQIEWRAKGKGLGTGG